MQNDTQLRDSNPDTLSHDVDDRSTNESVSVPSNSQLSREADQPSARERIAPEIDQDFIEAQRQHELERLKSDFKQSFGLSLSDQHVQVVAAFDADDPSYQAFEFRRFVDKEFDTFGFF